MMTFEKWWAEHYSHLDHRDICRTSERAWQAATAESAKEIAELKAEKVRHDQLVDYLKAGIAEELEQTILELKADNKSLVYVNNKLANEVVDLNKNLAALKENLAAEAAMRQVDANTIAELKAELVEWRDRTEANEGTTHE